MKNNGGLRIATARGAMLADPGVLGNSLQLCGAEIFEPQFWRARGQLEAAARGRGSAWFVGAEPRRWVLRHYRRGGFAARWSGDGYWWCGEERTRAFAEWRLLEAMRRDGLPVPRPVAAAYARNGSRYRCDLLTERIADALPLSAVLAAAALPESAWRRAGATIARFHAAGICHADLNAHNILRDGAGEFSLIDFDRGARRAPGAWRRRSLRRLRRSLDKVSRPLPAGRFSAAEWSWLLAGYG